VVVILKPGVIVGFLCSSLFKARGQGRAVELKPGVNIEGVSAADRFIVSSVLRIRKSVFSRFAGLKKIIIINIFFL
jgi:hypothetical protein